VLRALVGKGTVTGEPPSWWGLIQNDEVLVEVRFPATGTQAVLDVVAGTGLSLRGSVLSGRVVLESWGAIAEPELAAAVSGFRKRVEAAGGRVSVLAAPYPSIDRWGQVSGLPLMRRVKEQFDPGRRMSPGRFVGGI
jgi:glycolate oxidase FAD binding subunit